MNTDNTPEPNQNHRQEQEVAFQRGYDYSKISDEATRRLVQEKTLTIKDASRSGLACLVAMGNALLEVKRLLGHGQWVNWLRDEFRMSDRTAQNYMATAEKFRDSKNASIAYLPKAAIYLLASSRVPGEAVEAVVARTDAGERLDIAQVREVIAKHRDCPTKQDIKPPTEQAESTRRATVNHSPGATEATLSDPSLWKRLLMFAHEVERSGSADLVEEFQQMCAEEREAAAHSIQSLYRRAMEAMATPDEFLATAAR